VIFLFSNFPHVLGNAKSEWGYSPVFWLLIAFVELTYIVWNKEISGETPSVEAKRDLKRWSYLSLLGVAFAAFVFVYQEVGKNLILGHSISAVAVILLGGMIIKWNWDRYHRAKDAGQDFLE